MQCAVLDAPGRLEIRDCATPQPAPAEVLVEVELASLCGSDASLYRGKANVPLPVIPGHEAVGRIAALGTQVTGLAVGQRVVIHPNYACGRCPLCHSGQGNICPSKVRLGLDCNGVFAEYVSVPRQNAIPVPDGLASEVAVFTEPVAVAYHAFHKAKPAAGARALVIGAGVMGLLMTQFLRNAGCRIAALDLVDERLAVAQKLGAAVTAQDAAALAEQGPFDMIYETSGAPMGFSLATEVAAPGATIVLLGLSAAPHPVMTTLLVRKELRVFGSIVYTGEFPAVLALLEAQTIQTTPLVSSVHPLADIAECLEHFADPHRIKTLIRVKAR
jgi:2-desacetyl-2-hydroxyethyl bacteriochlorophyllide A dehydrogenase